jgi:hypothetical protein
MTTNSAPLFIAPRPTCRTSKQFDFGWLCRCNPLWVLSLPRMNLLFFVSVFHPDSLFTVICLGQIEWVYLFHVFLHLSFSPRPLYQIYRCTHRRPGVHARSYCLFPILSSDSVSRLGGYWHVGNHCLWVDYPVLALCETRDGRDECIAFSTALLFALPSLRSRPRRPLIGSAFDYWGFFWAEITTMGGIFWMSGMARRCVLLSLTLCPCVSCHVYIFITGSTSLFYSFTVLNVCVISSQILLSTFTSWNG